MDHEEVSKSISRPWIAHNFRFYLQRLKASLHFTVGKMCEEQEARTHISFDKHVMATINEIVWQKIKLVTQDLEAFAKY